MKKFEILNERKGLDTHLECGKVTSVFDLLTQFWMNLSKFRTRSIDPDIPQIDSPNTTMDKLYLSYRYEFLGGIKDVEDPGDSLSCDVTAGKQGNQINF